MSNKCCQSIAFWAGSRRVNPKKNYGIELIKYNYDVLLSVDGGMDYDTIIVNNISDDKESEDFLSEIDGSNTKNGKLKVLHRENIGISFGAHNHAYETFKDEYDYWFFTEDDAIFEKCGWYKVFYDRLCETMGKGENDIAFISGRKGGLECPPHGNPPLTPPHAPGGSGMSHISYLNEMYEKYGMLPHRKTDGKSFSSGGFKKDAIWSEIEFTGKFQELGYKIQYIGDVYYSRWWGIGQAGGESPHKIHNR